MHRRHSRRPEVSDLPIEWKLDMKTHLAGGRLSYGTNNHCEYVIARETIPLQSYELMLKL